MIDPVRQLDPDELAFGYPLGLAGPRPPEVAGGFRAAVERRLVAALDAGPVVVTFSGGRDSSAMLATAVYAARRQGLPLPIPFTFRNPDDPSSEETEWQETVVRHLGLTEWEIRQAGPELDWLGPVATRLGQAIGPTWPPNTHFHLPAFEAAGAGGTVVTGAFGDEALAEDPARVRLRAVARGAAPPQLRDVLRLAAAAGPRPLRALALRRRPFTMGPWVAPSASSRIRRRLRLDRAAAPLSWSGALRTFLAGRYRTVAMASLEAAASSVGASVLAPFGELETGAALAAEAGFRGFAGRDDAMRRLFGDLLPETVITRRGKASFRQTFWGAHTRRFAADWDGSGLPDTIDASTIRLVWQQAADPAQPLPPLAFAAAAALQAAWRAHHGPL